MENKYLVFYGDDNYPFGGWEDFEATFNSLDEAIEYIKSKDVCDHWAHIVYEKKIVMKARGNCYLENEIWEFKKIEGNESGMD